MSPAFRSARYGLSPVALSRSAPFAPLFMEVLNVLTTEDRPDAVAIPTIVPCDETYLCPCEGCEAVRAARMGQTFDRPQPWDIAA